MDDSDIRELCSVVRETALSAHRFLRHGHSEKIYENSLANRLEKRGLVVRRQHPVSVYDEDTTLLGDFYADLLLEDELILELKAVRQLVDEHTAQVLGYLRASRLKHAMLINFGAPVIQFKKFIFDESYESK